MTGTY